MIGLIDTSVLTNIADAIRGKLGVQTTYKPNEMPEAIESISGGGITPTGTKSITANGTYDVTTFASAQVNVPSSGITPTGTKQINITSNGTTTEDVTAYADAQITVNVPTGSTPTGTKNISITQNGTTTEDVANYANAQISVNVVNQDYEDALTAFGVTEDLTDSIEALTTYANGVTGESDTTLSDAVASLADGYGQGGGISDGYEITALNTDGFPTAVDHYGTEVHRQQYWNRTGSDGFWRNLTSITFKDVVTSVGQSAFYSCVDLTTIDTKDIVSVQATGFQSCTSLTSLDFPKLTSVGQNAFTSCTAVKHAIFPILTNCSVQRVLRGCLALEDVQLGSVGYGVTGLSNLFFEQDTQTGLTITVYTTGSYADTAVANARNGATNATIVIKASEATTYDGTSYATGDTILTSTPTS